MIISTLRSSCQVQNEAFGPNSRYVQRKNTGTNRSFLHREVASYVDPTCRKLALKPSLYSYSCSRASYAPGSPNTFVLGTSCHPGYCCSCAPLQFLNLCNLHQLGWTATGCMASGDPRADPTLFSRGTGSSVAWTSRNLLWAGRSIFAINNSLSIHRCRIVHDAAGNLSTFFPAKPLHVAWRVARPGQDAYDER